jgi:hypothetical protein
MKINGRGGLATHAMKQLCHASSVFVRHMLLHS